MATSNLVIDTITTTDNSISFQVVNFDASRYIQVTVSSGGQTYLDTRYYINQFTYQSVTVNNLSPGTTYTIRATSGTDDVSATATTTGSSGSTDTINGAVRIYKNLSEPINGVVRIEKSFIDTINGAVRIDAPSTADIDGVVNIDNPNETVSYKEIAGRVIIENTGSDEITGKTRIEKITTATIAGGVNVVKAENATISGLVRIENSGSTNINGRVRIRVAVPEKLPEDWEYSGVTEPEGWSKVDKDATSWNEVEKTNENWSKTEKNATSWTSGENEPESWSYPLEDNG